MKLFVFFLTALLPFTFSQNLLFPTVTISVDPKNISNEFNVICQLQNVKIETTPDQCVITYYFISENAQLGKIPLATWSNPAAVRELKTDGKRHTLI